MRKPSIVVESNPSESSVVSDIDQSSIDMNEPTSNDTNVETTIPSMNVEVIPSTSNATLGVDKTVEDINNGIVKAAALLRNTWTPHEMVPSKKIGHFLLHTIEEDQLYTKNKATATGVFYVCYAKDCNERVHVRPDGKCYFGPNFNGHLHGKATLERGKISLVNNIKLSVRDISNEQSGSKMASVKDVMYSKLSPEE